MFIWYVFECLLNDDEKNDEMPLDRSTNLGNGTECRVIRETADKSYHETLGAVAISPVSLATNRFHIMRASDKYHMNV